MASAREDRMQSRMRGAGRHVVQDDSFGFVLPAAEDLSPDSRAAANPPVAIESEPMVSETQAFATTITTNVDTVLPDAPAAREGRMQSRMRGAVRHQVADDAFGLILPVTAEEPPSEPADIILPDAGPTANTSAKRRRLNNGSPAALGSSSSPGQLSSGGSRTSPRLRRNGGVAPAGASSVVAQRTAASLATTRGSNPLNSSATKALSQLSLLGHSAEETPGATAALAALTVQDRGSARAGGGEDVDEEMELPPATRPLTRKPNSTRAAALLRSSPTSDPTQRGEEVVGESPRDAPGSGRRQRIRQNLDDTTTQSARLQRAVMEAEGGFEPTTSSPLARKTRNSTAGAVAKKAGGAGTSRTKKIAAQLSSSPGGGDVVERDSGGDMDDDGGIVDPLSSDPAPIGTPGIGQLSSPSLQSSTRRTAAAGAIRGSSSRNRTRNASSPSGSVGGEPPIDGEVAGSSPTLEATSKRSLGQQSQAIQPRAAAATSTTANLGPKGRRRPPIVPDSPEQTAKGRRAVAGTHQQEAGEQGGEREDPHQDDSIAEEIPGDAVAARLATNKNRKRPTAAPSAKSPPQPPSPELNSEPPDSARPAKRQRDATLQRQDDDGTAQQRKKKRAEERADEANPARQAQSKPHRTKARPKPNKTAPPKSTRRKRRSSGGNANEDEDERQAAGNDVIPIVVQRYTRPSAAALRRRRRDSLRPSGEGRGSDEDEDDILVLESAEIPYADRSGVNAVDVLTQMCEEVIDATLEKMQQRATAAMEGSGGAGGPGNAVKKEMRTKMRALEAFQEELRTRLLEHTIALDSLHSLRKRVRAAQREKLSLRADILRIRAERQEVALKMDAVRIRHEQENAETLHQLALSSTLHDIELAVENSRSTALEDSYQEPSAAAASSARMANLEITIGRMAEQAGGSGWGGNLDKIREFNAMLERAAAVLEGR